MTEAPNYGGVNGVSARIEHAYDRCNAMRQLRGEEKLDQAAVAARVGEMEVGRGEPYSQSTFSKWLGGGTPDTLDAFVALGKVLGVDPGWLAFGEDSQAQGPTNPLDTRYRRLD